MEKQPERVIRQGCICRFTVNGTDYGAFVWQVGRSFCGRVVGHPQVPQSEGQTMLAVREALSSWLATATAE